MTWSPAGLAGTPSRSRTPLTPTGLVLRLDKWLWAARIFKTRSLATEACRRGHVKIAGQSVKPAHDVRVGETILVRKDRLTQTLKVLGLSEKRVGAPIAKTLVEDLTAPEEYAQARPSLLPPEAFRPKGLGRPTKKERRDLDRFKGPDF